MLTEREKKGNPETEKISLYNVGVTVGFHKTPPEKFLEDSTMLRNYLGRPFPFNETNLEFVQLYEGYLDTYVIVDLGLDRKEKIEWAPGYFADVNLPPQEILPGLSQEQKFAFEQRKAELKKELEVALTIFLIGHPKFK